ncbi:haloacid dehalogenase [Leuconostoc litchii]|uniref:HAD family phosphatase n=1 Tax=Leuconostoc litchii TaxID=1981069 RepID=A0A6P2CPS1_9LACO|nr:Cof-type HAD-IIB family hydrolase [Leuconostoc litchii]TYC47383.1 HAD family phosphatase [Leuconostoc litchii]GMA69393.1 haloacid dehalogenase [Leuconostoc litchii]
MIKLILSDLDETLLNDDGSVNAKNIVAVQKFVQDGGYFVPNTGRSYKSVFGTLRDLGLNQQEKQYVVSYNGGAIVEINANGAENIVVQHGMDLELAKSIFSLGQIQSDIDTHIYTLDTLFIHNISKNDERYMKERNVPYTEMTDANLDFLTYEKPIMKVIFEHTNPMVLQKIADTVNAQLADYVLTTFSSNRYVEFNPKGSDKGSAGLELAKMLGISRDEVAALGDNLNDAAQIKAAGVGVAVANAKPEIKELADVVLSKTNNEGAVAEFIDGHIGK